MGKEMEKKIRESLKTVIDPELNLSIVDLGLVYEIKEENGHARVKLTFTSPMCPVGPMILSSVKKKAADVKGVKEVEVELTFNPPWTPHMATEEIKAQFEEYL